METYTDTLPPFWWLTPWRHVRRLHAATLALNDALHQMEGDGGRWHEQAAAAEHEISRLNDELSLANAKVDELAAHIDDAFNATPVYCKDGKGPASWIKNIVEENDKWCERIGELEKRNRDLSFENLALRGQVERLKDEARKAKRNAKKGKLLFEDKVGGNSIYAPKGSSPAALRANRAKAQARIDAKKGGAK
jgi:cell division protein FtsB